MVLFRKLNCPSAYTHILVGIKDPVLQLQAFQCLCLALPDVHQNLLARVLRFLKKAADQEEVSLMGADNLSVVFGPTLLSPPKSLATDVASIMEQTSCVAFLLEYSADLFIVPNGIEN